MSRLRAWLDRIFLGPLADDLAYVRIVPDIPGEWWPVVESEEKTEVCILRRPQQ
jgi:hypothetical protein